MTRAFVSELRKVVALGGARLALPIGLALSTAVIGGLRATSKEQEEFSVPKCISIRLLVNSRQDKYNAKHSIIE